MAIDNAELQRILHFAEINGIMNWPFDEVYNEYLTTKDVAESYERTV